MPKGSNQASLNGRWWIIGASEGLGRELARKLDAEGAELILSARSEDRLKELAQELRAAQALPLDVLDGEKIEDAAATVGAFDGLIYCAGAYSPMKATEWDRAAGVTIAQVNFIGAMQVLGAVVPGMVKRNRGRIMLIGSLSWFRGLPGAIGYGASKAALMHLAENLRIDLRDTAIKVQLANPGFIDTRLTRQNDFKMPQLMQPDEAAEHVMKALRGGRFSTSFPRPFAWLFQAGRYLPLRLFQALF